MQSVQPKCAVAYYRSASFDEGGISLQKHAVRGFAERQGISILHEEVDNGFSGADQNRPGFSKLLQEWIYGKEAPCFDYLLVKDRARLLRSSNPGDLNALVTSIRLNKKEVVVIDELEPELPF